MAFSASAAKAYSNGWHQAVDEKCRQFAGRAARRACLEGLKRQGVHVATMYVLPEDKQ